ncbi:hypothetical protein HMPREF1584_01395 [Gardnerella vaginalis JCP8481A]|nr:hypothetical protein HMPREF1584_01395 [Gardnerella vaginalis JCP8481A]
MLKLIKQQIAAVCKAMMQSFRNNVRKAQPQSYTSNVRKALLQSFRNFDGDFSPSTLLCEILEFRL